MNIYMLDSADWQKIDTKKISKEKIKKIIADAAYDAAKILPSVSNCLSIIVKPNLPHVSKIYGVGGSTFDSELIDITFDSSIPHGEIDLENRLRNAVFHEINHSVRYNLQKMDEDLINNAVLEGLATVFERDYTGADNYFAKYEDEITMQKWYEELQSGKDDNC